jgi:hypothetical protein
MMEIPPSSLKSYLKLLLNYRSYVSKLPQNSLSESLAETPDLSHYFFGDVGCFDSNNFILIFIYDEQQFDQFHANKDSLYGVITHS